MMIKVIRHFFSDPENNMISTFLSTEHSGQICKKIQMASF